MFDGGNIKPFGKIVLPRQCEMGRMDQKKMELIAQSTPLVLSAVKLLYNRRVEMERVERQGEIEIKKAEKQAELLEKQRQVETARQQQQPQRRGHGAEIDQMIENETCGICRDLLHSMKSLPPDDQSVALGEFEDMKHALDTEGKDGVQRVLEESEVLDTLI